MSGSKGFDKLIKDIEREMRYWGMPGAAYAAVKDGDIACIGGIGLRDREMKKPAGADTLFCIASCSKAFTGALASILISEGKLDPDRPVREYIKEFGLARNVFLIRCHLFVNSGHRHNGHPSKNQ